MKNAHNHIIEKVFVEINTNNSEKAFGVKDDIGTFLNEILFPRIEELFDNFDTNDRILRIEKLELNLEKPFVSLNHELAGQLVSETENKIAGLKRETATLKKQSVVTGKLFPENRFDNFEGYKLIEENQNREIIFFEFLVSGNYPWFSDKNRFEEIFQIEIWNSLLADEIFVSNLKLLLMTNKTYLQRFVNQVPFENMLSFLFVITPFFKPLEGQFQSICLKFPEKQRKVFLINSIQIFLKTKQSEQHSFFAEYLVTAASLLKEIDSLEDIPEEAEMTKKLTIDFGHFSETMNDTSGKTDDSIRNFAQMKSEISADDIKNENVEFQGYVRNAGLILLHPFLKTFLIATGIADPSGKIAEKNYDLAVQALHFIATGNESVFEPELVFEKFFCGIPMQFPIIRESLLTDEVKNEALEMLNEVIKQWQALKNTTPTGLRETFLQRNALLQITEKGYNLVFETKTTDILLNRIPWSYSIVKWYLIDKLIYVEWQV